MLLRAFVDNAFNMGANAFRNEMLMISQLFAGSC